MFTTTKADLQNIWFSILWTPIMKLWNHIIQAIQYKDLWYSGAQYNYFLDETKINPDSIDDLKTLIRLLSPKN